MLHLFVTFNDCDAYYRGNVLSDYVAFTKCVVIKEILVD